MKMKTHETNSVVLPDWCVKFIIRWRALMNHRTIKSSPVTWTLRNRNYKCVMKQLINCEQILTTVCQLSGSHGENRGLARNVLQFSSRNRPQHNSQTTEEYCSVGSVNSLHGIQMGIRQARKREILTFIFSETYLSQSLTYNIISE